MSDIQAVRIPRRNHAQLWPLRKLRGLKVHATADEIWLRVTEDSEEIQQALRGLPAAMGYRVLEDGQLCRLGDRIPSGFLPEGPWEGLWQWMPVELPRPLLPGIVTNRIGLQLIRDSQPRDANLLLTSLEHWLSYGSTAPQVRLDRWQFAVSTDCEILIRGVPLPPIPGKQLYEERGIAVPCGWHWFPAVDADVLARAFSVSDRNLVLWREDGRIESIADDQFARATRSAIRLSAEAKRNG